VTALVGASPISGAATTTGGLAEQLRHSRSTARRARQQRQHFAHVLSLFHDVWENVLGQEPVHVQREKRGVGNRQWELEALVSGKPGRVKGLCQEGHVFHYILMLTPLRPTSGPAPPLTMPGRCRTAVSSAARATNARHWSA
jgi:hypothetical protein